MMVMMMMMMMILMNFSINTEKATTAVQSDAYRLNNNIFIYCNWVVTRWQWLFYMQTKHEIVYY
jgi:hypothetical protein